MSCVDITSNLSEALLLNTSKRQMQPGCLCAYAGSTVLYVVHPSRFKNGSPSQTPASPENVTHRLHADVTCNHTQSVRETNQAPE